MIEVHETEKPRCQYCDKTFATFVELTKHTISHNRADNENPEFEAVMCDKCSNCFSSKHELNLHVKVVHETEENEQRKALLCDICFECFESDGLLNLHIKACHQKASVSTLWDF